jgi:hypothetical protein
MVAVAVVVEVVVVAMNPAYHYGRVLQEGILLQ